LLNKTQTATCNFKSVAEITFALTLTYKTVAAGAVIEPYCVTPRYAAQSCTEQYRNWQSGNRNMKGRKKAEKEGRRKRMEGLNKNGNK
jgi:hypothetical protein